MTKCDECHNEFNEFKPSRPNQTICSRCWESYRKLQRLDSYYNEKGILKKEIYLDNPKQYATYWGEKVEKKDRLARKQLYDFKKKILKARDILRLKGIEAARPILEKTQRDAEYQFNRGVVPRSFKEFLDFHIPIAKADKKALEGFYEYFESIYMYFPMKE